jgi:hypothetical protein
MGSASIWDILDLPKFMDMKPLTAIYLHPHRLTLDTTE